MNRQIRWKFHGQTDAPTLDPKLRRHLRIIFVSTGLFAADAGLTSHLADIIKRCHAFLTPRLTGQGGLPPAQIIETPNGDPDAVPGAGDFQSHPGHLTC